MSRQVSLSYASVAILVHLNVLSVTHIKYRSRGTRAYYPISTISVIVGRGFVSGNDGHVSRDLSNTGLSMCYVLVKGDGGVVVVVAALSAIADVTNCQSTRRVSSRHVAIRLHLFPR